MPARLRVLAGGAPRSARLAAFASTLRRMCAAVFFVPFLVPKRGCLGFTAYLPLRLPRFLGIYSRCLTTKPQPMLLAFLGEKPRRRSLAAMRLTLRSTQIGMAATSGSPTR